jgi:hypothetical protein
MRKIAAYSAGVFLTGCATVLAQNAARPTQEELAAITERGKMLYEYDQAAWHATDAVQMANPKTVEGQRYIAKKENGKWRVVFGKLNEDRSRFGITYEAEQQANPREFTPQKEPEEREDAGFFLYAARAIELAMKDFGGTGRPYNIAALPGPADQILPVPYSPRSVRYRRRPGGFFHSGGQERRRRFRGHIAEAASSRGKVQRDHDL